MTTTKPAAKARSSKASKSATSKPPSARRTTPKADVSAAEVESPPPASAPMGHQEPLPGLEEVTDRTIPYLEVGVRRTIAALYGMGNVQEHHAAHTAAAVELAQIIDAKKHSGRMSTVGNDMRAMIELLDRIVPEKSEMDATLKAAMDEWSTAHAAAEPWSSPGSPPF